MSQAADHMLLFWNGSWTLLRQVAVLATGPVLLPRQTQTRGAGPCWVSTAVRLRSRTPRGHTSIRCHGRWLLALIFKDQPTLGLSRTRNPTLKTRSQRAHKMHTSSHDRQLWCSRNSGVGRVDVILFIKKNKKIIKSQRQRVLWQNTLA